MAGVGRGVGWWGGGMGVRGFERVAIRAVVKGLSFKEAWYGMEQQEESAYMEWSRFHSGVRVSVSGDAVPPRPATLGVGEWGEEERATAARARAGEHHRGGGRRRLLRR